MRAARVIFRFQSGHFLFALASAQPLDLFCNPCKPASEPFATPIEPPGVTPCTPALATPQIPRFGTSLYPPPSQVKATVGTVVGTPDPAVVMTAASRSVLTRLDKVESGVIEFFVPAAEKLLSTGQPSRVLAAALAAMSGFKNVPQPRSLLTGEGGRATLRLLSVPGRVDGYNSLAKALQKVRGCFVVFWRGGGVCGGGGVRGSGLGGFVRGLGCCS